MTQKLLADRAGVTQSFISQVENDLVEVERRSTLIALANALEITVGQLLGVPDEPADPTISRAIAAVPQVRAAMAQLEFGDQTGASRMAATDIRRRLDALYDLRLVCDAAGAAADLAPLLRDVSFHGPALRAEALHCVSGWLRMVNHRDLAWRAADLAMLAARESEDLRLLGPIEFGRLKCLPTETPLLVARQAQQVADELQPATSDPEIRRGYGALHLSWALASATVNSSRSTIEDHLDEAAQAAETLGEPVAGGLSMAFGPTNVKLWRMASALELGEPHKVVDIAQSVQPEVLRDANRVSTYWLDYGRALAAIGGREHESIGMLARAESVAPQYIRALPAARNAVTVMISRARKRALADDLRRLADRMGLQS
jgi:transcriptional regulator with XRE-family HTH domain